MSGRTVPPPPRRPRLSLLTMDSLTRLASGATYLPPAFALHCPRCLRQLS